MTPLFSPPLESPIAETREVRPLSAPGSRIRVSHRCSPHLIGRVLAGQAYMEQLGARLRTIGVDKVVRSPPRRTPYGASLMAVCAAAGAGGPVSGAECRRRSGRRGRRCDSEPTLAETAQPPALQSSCPQTRGGARQLAHGVACCAVADEQGDRSQVWTELWALHRENKQVSNTNPAPNSQEGAVKAYGGGGRQRVRRQRGSDGGLQQRREQLQFTPRREPG